jgi:hypothetical protein
MQQYLRGSRREAGGEHLVVAVGEGHTASQTIERAAPTGFGDLGSDVCSRDLNFPIDARAHRYLRVSGNAIKAAGGRLPVVLLEHPVCKTA